MQTSHVPRALAISRAVAPLLREPVRVGAVQSVFRRAANVWLPPETLLALTDPTVTRVPNGVVVGVANVPRGDTFLGLRAGMAALAGDGLIRVPAAGLRLETVDTPVWDPRPPFPGRTVAPAVLGQNLDRLAWRIRERSEAKPWSFASLLAPLARCEEGSEAIGHDMDAHGVLLARQAQPAAAALLAGIEAGEIERISAAARRLAGLGHGLTPSGDDLLAGVCGALVLAAVCLPANASEGCQAGCRREQAAAIAAAAAGRTTLLSTTWLDHAARGEFSAELGHVLVALADPEGSGLDGAIARLLAVGELSGLDTAMGLLLGGRAMLAPFGHHT